MVGGGVHVCLCVRVYVTHISQTPQYLPGRQLQGETEEVDLVQRPKYPPLIPLEPPGLQVLRWSGSTPAGLRPC